MDAPRPAVILESDAWDFLSGSARKVVGLVVTAALFLAAVWVVSYVGGEAVLSAVLLVGLLGVLALGYASAVELRLLVKALSLPLLVAVLLFGEDLPAGTRLGVYAFAGLAAVFLVYSFVE